MSLFLDVWRSFRAMPLWVQLWVGLILGPVNLASLAFLGAPKGGLIAALAIGGMLPNFVLIVAERGLSKAMSISHVLLWTPLLFVLWPLLGTPYPTLLFAVNLISLVFDVKDTWEWWRGDRAVAGA